MYILNGRESFYQWDLNQKISGGELKVGDEVHFFNIKQSKALVLKAYSYDEKVVVDVPNILLQSSHPITVYRYIKNDDESFTIATHQFIVEQRPKPDDYVYTETEVLNYASLDKRIAELEKGGGGSGEPGEDGFSPIATVEQTESGATITITDKNGTTTATVINGYTPKRGTDYWTDDDKAEIKSYVDEAILGGEW